MSLTTQDFQDTVAAIVAEAKEELQAEIRHLSVQQEVIDDKLEIVIGMLRQNMENEAINTINSFRIRIAEANVKSLKSLVALHDKQLRAKTPVAATAN